MNGYYRILDSDSENESQYVVSHRSLDMRDVDSEKLAIPVKIYDMNLAYQIQRKMTYGHHDEEFVRGLVEGILLQRQDSVEYDAGNAF